MAYLDEELDITHQKINNLEKEIEFLKDALTSHAQTIKETQHFLIKLAHNQSALTKRISQWPYIPVSLNSSREDDHLGE
jgi:predicted  nucleic acid-binding Zn-ribbon protein